MVDMVAERARVMLLDKAFLRAALRAAPEAARAARGVRQPHGRDLCVVIGKVALGRLDFGKDHAVAAADLDVALGGRCGLLLVVRPALSLIVAAHAEDSAVPVPSTPRPSAA